MRLSLEIVAPHAREELPFAALALDARDGLVEPAERAMTNDAEPTTQEAKEPKEPKEAK